MHRTMTLDEWLAFFDRLACPDDEEWVIQFLKTGPDTFDEELARRAYRQWNASKAAQKIVRFP